MQLGPKQIIANGRAIRSSEVAWAFYKDRHLLKDQSNVIFKTVLVEKFFFKNSMSSKGVN